MLTFWSGRGKSFCDGVSRRNFLQLGAAGVCGLTMADILQAKAEGRQKGKLKSVILIILPGGPSQLDTWDMKPNAGTEIRGEFKPIKTNLPGLDVSELLPQQAKIADKFAVIRGIETHYPEHKYEEVCTGYPPKSKPTERVPNERPAFGSVISWARGGSGPDKLPAFVNLQSAASFGDLRMANGPAYLGVRHQYFSAGGKADTLKSSPGLTTERLQDRQQLQHALEGVRRNLDDTRGPMSDMDEFSKQAFDILSSTKIQEAFDINREPMQVREKYGSKAQYSYYGGKNPWDPAVFLQARRLAEAGVPVITFSIGHWDHHSPPPGLFNEYRTMLPSLDQALYGLFTDLTERGLDKEVAVVVWGEMGRTPKVNKDRGRDHWPQAGCALVAGGGMKMGQVIGATDKIAGRSKGAPYTPQNVFATLYHLFGIDPTRTIEDRIGRPLPLLDDTNPVKELL